MKLVRRNNGSWAIPTTTALAIIGCAIALPLTAHHYVPNVSLPCGSGNACNRVLSSQYSHIGPVPIALLGFGMYVCIAILSAQSYRRKGQLHSNSGSSVRQIKVLTGSVWSLSLIGSILSWALQFAAITEAQSFCSWCFASAVIFTLLLLSSSWEYGRTLRLIASKQRIWSILPFGISVIIAAGVCVLVYVARVGVSQMQPQFVSIDDTDLKPLLFHASDNKNAPFLIIEWADFQCRSCRQAVDYVAELSKRHPERYRVAYVYAVLPTSRWSLSAAQATEAASEQGAFWEMLHLIFQHQDQMDDPTFASSQFDAWAGQLKMNTAIFRSQRSDARITSRVSAYVELQHQWKVVHTPTFLVIRRDTPHRAMRALGIMGLLQILDAYGIDEPAPLSR